MNCFSNTPLRNGSAHNPYVMLRGPGGGVKATDVPVILIKKYLIIFLVPVMKWLSDVCPLTFPVYAFVLCLDA